MLDVFVLGKAERYVLPKDHDLFSILIKDIPDGARPELRLKIVASDEANIGRIYAQQLKKYLSSLFLLVKMVKWAQPLKHF